MKLMQQSTSGRSIQRHRDSEKEEQEEERLVFRLVVQRDDAGGGSGFRFRFCCCFGL